MVRYGKRVSKLGSCSDQVNAKVNYWLLGLLNTRVSFGHLFNKHLLFAQVWFFIHKTCNIFLVMFPIMTVFFIPFTSISSLIFVKYLHFFTVWQIFGSLCADLVLYCTRDWPN